MNYLGLASAGLSALGQSAAALTKYKNRVEAKGEEYDAAQDALAAQTSEATDFNQLAEEFNSLQWSNFNPTTQDLIGGDAENALGILGSTAGAALQGMQASGSGWGAFMGVPVLAAELGGFFSAKGQAEDKAEEIKARNERINETLTNRFNYRASAISQNNLNNALLNLKALGGKLHTSMDFTNGVRFIDEGGSHEQNPFGGVPQGIASDGLTNLVEEGEVIFNDYVFSKRLSVPKADKELLGLKKDKDYTYAEAAEVLQRESEERANDPLSKKGLEAMMGRLQGSQEILKQKQDERRFKREFAKLSPEEQVGLLAEIGKQQFAKGGHLFAFGDPLEISSLWAATPVDYTEPIDLNNVNVIDNIVSNPDNLERIEGIATPETVTKTYEGTGIRGGLSEQTSKTLTDTFKQKNDDFTLVIPGSKSSGKSGFSWGQAMKAAPILGSAIGALSAFMDKPNYNNIARAERAMASVPRVAAGRVGQKLTYRPIDVNYLANIMNNQAIGARRAALEGSMGNSAAAAGQLLALNYGSQTALGNALMQAQKENDAQKAQVAGFNRETDSFNIQNSLRAAMQNQEMDARRAYFLMQTGQLRDQELARIQANRSAALTNLFQNIGNYGSDLVAREQVAAGAKAGVFGNLGDNASDYLKTLGIAGGKKKGGPLFTIVRKKGGKHA